MRFILSLLFHVVHLPFTTAEVLGEWTLRSLTRTCDADGKSCQYSLDISIEYFPNTTDPNAETKVGSECGFSVKAGAFPEDNPPNLLANETSFKAVDCWESRLVEQPSQPDSQPRFVVNGGYDRVGNFWTIVPTDRKRDAYAFFGYPEEELESGVTAKEAKKAKALKVGTFERGVEVWGFEGKIKRDNDNVNEGEHAIKVMALDVQEWKKVEGRMWQVKGLTRFPDLSLNATDISFSIIDNVGAETHCSLAIRGTDPRESWYGKACGRDFTISWGYNGRADSAVMTVCYPRNGTSAWFGFDHVNKALYLGNSRKEPVYYSGCA